MRGGVIDMAGRKSGMSKERLGRIERAVDSHLGEDQIAGAVSLVARRGEIVHLRAAGFAYLERSVPMQIDSLFRIYSMTKPVTMVALLMLFEEGRVRLTDPVSRFIPEFGDIKVVRDETAIAPTEAVELVDLERPVTVQDLMTHTAGLSYHFGDFGVVERMYRESAVFSETPLNEFVDQIARMPLAFQPGTRWRYSVGHDVVARIVEIASGLPYGEYLRKRIFDPLGMSDTDFTVPPEKLNRFTAEYGYGDVRDPAFSNAESDAAAAESRPPLLRAPNEGLEVSEHSIFRGGHGLVSTAGDYYRFCSMLLRNGEIDGVRLLGRKTVELMRSPQLRNDIVPEEFAEFGIDFGLGVAVRRRMTASLDSIGTHSWGGAAGTIYWIDPVEDLIGILLIQCQGAIAPIGEDFKVAVYQAIID